MDAGKQNQHKQTARLRLLPHCCGMAMISILPAVVCVAQEPPAVSPPQAATQHAAAAMPLAELLKEAAQNNPGILAAQKAAEAARYGAAQVSALPDPQFQVQHFTLGSPRPFAGYTNNDFAYIGLGASQQIPFPGKLKLRGAVVDRDADAVTERAEIFLRDEIEKLKTTYFRLAYLQQALGILQRDDLLLQQIEQQARAHYGAGLGNQ